MTTFEPSGITEGSTEIVLPSVALVPVAVIPVDHPQHEAQPQYAVISNEPNTFHESVLTSAWQASSQSLASSAVTGSASAVQAIASM